MSEPQVYRGEPLIMERRTGVRTDGTYVDTLYLPGGASWPKVIRFGADIFGSDAVRLDGDSLFIEVENGRAEYKIVAHQRHVMTYTAVLWDSEVLDA